MPSPTLFERLKYWAKSLKTELMALYLAYKRRDVPLYARLFALLVVAYAFSPIDLIPDFIPVLGYLDDLILLPAGIWLAVRMIPTDILEECRIRARELEVRPKNYVTAVLFVLLWTALLIWIGFRLLG